MCPSHVLSYLTVRIALMPVSCAVLMKEVEPDWHPEWSGWVCPNLFMI